jgi:two-component system cell cycle sensor histidine kinase/response regulator CckA
LPIKTEVPNLQANPQAQDVPSLWPLPARRFSYSWILTALLVALSIPPATGTPESPPLRRPDFNRGIAARQPLRVGSTSDSFPYGYLGPDGAWTGYAADLFNAVAREMNLQFVREGLPGSELHERFRLGDFDLLQAFSQTGDREHYAEFSVPFLTLQGSIFVRKGGPVRTIADLNDRPFAIIGAGSIGEKFLRDYKLHTQPVYVSSSDEALRLIEEGRCAGAFVSRLTALSVIESAGLKRVVMLGDPLSEYDIRHCFAVHKGDAQLLARLNEGLAILHRTGEHAAIYKKWFGRFDPPRFTGEEVLRYVLAALTFGFLAALWGLLRQRTLRKRIARQAAELAEKESLLSALYQNIPTGMCVLETRPEGRFVLSLNPQAELTLALSARTATGRPLSQLALPPVLAGLLAKILQRPAAPGEIHREELTLGDTRQRLLVTLVSLAASHEGFARVCVLTEDITRRRQLDEEVAQSRRLRALGELVGGIAHEFNNLLTPVMLKIGEIQSDWAGDSRLQNEIGIIQRVATRAAELTHRLLAFGRRSAPQLETASLSALATSCVELLRQTIDRRIVIESSIPPALPSLQINATDLHQALLNLLLNARDTLAAKLDRRIEGWIPRIQIAVVPLPGEAIDPPPGHARPALGWQRLTVRDNGEGMTAEVRERIFEPFFTTKGVGHGSGLGLATVWHIVTESGGHVTVESVVGEGTAFHLVLPVNAPPPPAPAHSSAPVPAKALRPPPPASRRVFIAEDEELIAQTLVAFLRRAGHTVEHAPDGTSAWERIRDRLTDFDLLIFDINMPGLDGIELSRRVRAPGRYSGKLMIVSGRLSTSEREILTNIGVDVMLAKPFTMDEFLRTVNTVCAPSVLAGSGVPPPHTSEITPTFRPL